jgi:hypothetical protein
MVSARKSLEQGINLGDWSQWRSDFEHHVPDAHVSGIAHKLVVGFWALLVSTCNKPKNICFPNF